MLNLIVGFILGVMALWIYLELIALAAKRRVPPPTKAKRKQPNAQGENGGVWYEAEPGVRYEWINLTGEEQ